MNRKKPLARRAKLKPGGPLKRTPMPPRTKPMRSTSPATAKVNRKIAAERRLYAKRFGMDECHEVLGGKWRKITKLDRRFWLAVRREEHDAIQYEPKAKQMCRKRRQDYDYYDLDAFNELYRDGGAEWPVTPEQVDAFDREME